jgi:hypothetical protein
VKKCSEELLGHGTIIILYIESFSVVWQNRITVKLNCSGGKRRDATNTQGLFLRSNNRPINVQIDSTYHFKPGEESTI